jgi:uncharacterized protein (DUF58 family)
MKASREGKRFILTTGLILVAAFNTGNNLIYLILSMMLSILTLSFLILKINIRGLMLKVSHVKPLFVNKTENMDVVLSNKKRFIPSYSLNVFMPGRASGGTYFPEIAALTSKSGSIPVLYKKRGIYKYGDFSIESSFPFIFLSDTVLCRIDGEILVYPEIKEIDGMIPDIAGKSYELSHIKTGIGDEFSMIREFRYGDNWRSIHWKASAKASKLMVMEYTSDEPRKLTVILDNLLPHDPESFEKAVSFAASVADMFLKEEYFVRLITSRKMIPFGTGRDHLFKMLDVLAVVEGQDTWEYAISDEPEGPTILILCSGGSPVSKFISASNMVVYASNL